LKSAEFVERRVLAKRNTGQPPVTGTQSLEGTESGLARIRAAAKREPKLQFNNLYHHITYERLHQAYFALKRKAASGVDNMSWAGYGERLDERLSDLHTRLQQHRYKPQPSLRMWITKENGAKRPIGITALEDKIVQQALAWILQSIYEEDFLGFSYGFRPGRSQHNALDAIYIAITQKKVSWILDADIQGFFDNLDHDWLLKFIQHRISDKRILRLVERTLKAGVEEEGVWSKTTVGTPQGSVISPLYANIYLHYVLDLWVEQWRKRKARGEVYIVRYCDDFVLGFQYRSDGERFLQDLKLRLQRFGLKLHKEKTRLIEFGRFAISNRKERGQRKPETFDFLGFKHICGQRFSDGQFKLIRHTIMKRQRKKLKEVKEQLKKMRCVNVHDQGRWLRSLVNGVFNYFGVPDNRKSLEVFRTVICQMWIKSLRRRSQRGSNLNWNRFNQLVRHYIPVVRLIHPYPTLRWCV
jgi:RNA-directed DNA polymerase